MVKDCDELATYKLEITVEPDSKDFDDFTVVDLLCKYHSALYQSMSSSSFHLEKIKAGPMVAT